MPLTNNQYETIKSKVKHILKLDDRIEEKRNDMNQGDTSPFLKSLFGDKRTLLVKVGQSFHKKHKEKKWKERNGSRH